MNCNFFQRLLSLLTDLCQWRPGKLARDTVKMTLGMGGRTLIQVSIFIIVTRTLGIADYGAYTAVLALATALGVLCGFGTQMLIVRDVAREPAYFSRAWGLTLSAIIISIPLFFPVYLLLAHFILPADISFSVVVLLGIAELFFAPISLAAITAYQGHERIGRSSRMVLVPVIPRLGAALLLVSLTDDMLPELRLTAWAGLYTIAALLASLYAVCLVRQDLGAARQPSARGVWRGLCEGLPFAFGGVALRLYTDIDKTMLAGLATLTVTGAYSAGYRLADIASLPVIALLTAAMPRFFRSGNGEVRQVLLNGFRLLPIPFAYASFVGLALYIGAEFIPYILGNNFMTSISTLRWLAWFPLISLPRLFLQHALIGANRQQGVVTILSMGALFNIGLNIVLIPVWGWRGAVVATYSVEIIMTLMMLLIAWIAICKANYALTNRG